MFDAIAALMTPNVSVRIVLRVAGPDKMYRVQNQLKTCGLPGIARVVSGGLLEVVWEGRELILRKKMDDLLHNPLLSTAPFVATTWIPYTGKYDFFTIAF